MTAGNSLFPLQRLQITCLLFVPEHIDLVQAKIRQKVGVVRLANILAMPGPVAVCILEPEKPTGLEIRYV